MLCSHDLAPFSSASQREAGTFGNESGLRREEDCLPCSPGHYCNTTSADRCQRLLRKPFCRRWCRAPAASRIMRAIVLLRLIHLICTRAQAIPDFTASKAQIRQLQMHWVLQKCQPLLVAYAPSAAIVRSAAATAQRQSSLSPGIHQHTSAGAQVSGRDLWQRVRPS